MPDASGSVELTPGPVEPVPGPVRAPAVVRSHTQPSEADQATPEQVSGVPDAPRPPWTPGKVQAADPEAEAPAGFPIAPENEALNESLRVIQERNTRVFQQLAAMGAGVSPGDIIDLRINKLLEFLWPLEDPKNQRRRILFERMFSEALNDLIEPLVSQARQYILAQGANLPPDVLEDMAAGQGIQPPAARRTRKGG